jgi:DNA topoisomerase-6 subunit A
MAIPKAKFIGLSSTAPGRCELPRSIGITLNETNFARAKELLSDQ